MKSEPKRVENLTRLSDTCKEVLTVEEGNVPVSVLITLLKDFL